MFGGLKFLTYSGESVKSKFFIKNFNRDPHVSLMCTDSSNDDVYGFPFFFLCLVMSLKKEIEEPK